MTSLREGAICAATRFAVWLNTGDNSMIAAGIALMPLFVIVGIGLIGAPDV